MPFQRRTLSYWVGIRYGAGGRRRHNTRNSSSRSDCGGTPRRQQLQKRLRQGKRRHAATATTKTTTATTNQKTDLLSTLFKHRVRNFNDAFLSTPRRTTRNYAKTNTPPSISRPSPDVSCINHRNGMDETQQNTPNHESHSQEKRNGATALIQQNMGNNLCHAGSEEELGPEPPNVDKEQCLNTSNTMLDNTTTESCAEAALVSESGESMKLTNGDIRQLHNLSPVSELEDMNYLLDWKDPILSAEASHETSAESYARVLFHFLFYDDQLPCFLTDATPENYAGHRRCIFCYFDGGSDTGLLMHCVTCHGQFLSYKAARSEDGTVSKQPA